jgi:hypothetical protein
MELSRWTNPHQAQTLHLATILLYVRAALGLLFRGTTFALYWGATANVVAALAMIAAGLGIANGFKWGYRLAVVVTALAIWPIVAWLIGDGPLGWHLTDYVLVSILPVAHLVLLLHPMSREYQRVWMR